MKPIKIKSSLPPRPKHGEVLTYLGHTLHYTIGDVIAAPVKVGDEVESSRGDTYTVTGGNPPAHAGSSGRVFVEADGRSAEYFPSVIGAKWVEEGA